ncbi:MAG: class I SAM-dependent methyltransferase [Pseudomonas sp.]|uniref:methyltransferase domain-containing protein n=1 Tax=Pseudomonas sp. TaxID=306 RepID=UPI0039821FCD
MPSSPHSTQHPADAGAAKQPAGHMLSAFALRAAQWRTRQLIGRALELADEPSLVLNLPCAAEGLRPLLSASENRVVIAAETSAERLQEALTGLPADFAKRVHALQTSAVRIDLGENAVDCIFSMHYLQQLNDPQQRMALLKEFNRVTRDSVIVSLGATSSLAAPQRNGHLHNRAQIEEEFVQAGFSLTGHRDFIPGLAMLRLYVLRKNA